MCDVITIHLINIPTSFTVHSTTCDLNKVEDVQKKKVCDHVNKDHGKCTQEGGVKVV